MLYIYKYITQDVNSTTVVPCILVEIVFSFLRKPSMFYYSNSSLNKIVKLIAITTSSDGKCASILYCSNN